MHAGALDQPVLNPINGSTIEYPLMSESKSMLSGLTLAYAIQTWLEIRVEANRGGGIEVWASGHHGSFEDLYDGVSLSTRADSRPVGTALVAMSVSSLRVGLGPSVSRVEVQAYGSERDFAPAKRSRTGLVLEVGVSLPDRGRFLVDVSVQRHWLGSQEIGPYPIHDRSGDLATTFPATRVSFDHTSMKLGVGLRW